MRTVLVGLLLAGLAGLGWAGAPALRGWVTPLVPLDHYPILFAVFFACWLAADRAGPRARPWVLLGGAVVQGLAFDPALFAIMAAWVLLYHRVLFAPLHGALKAGFLVASLLTWAVLCRHHPLLMRGGYLFATGFFLQALRVLVDLRASGWTRVPRRELLIYFLIAPFWIVVPYMLAIVPLEVMRRGIARRDPEVVRAGIRTIALATAASAALFAATTFLYDPRAGYVDLLRQGHLLALPAGLLFYPFEVVAQAFCAAGVLLGLLRLLGIAAPPFLDRPLLADSVTDWWRRWNITFRDLLVDLFWYPVVLRLRRRPDLAIVLGCAAVFLVGSPLLHWPKRYFNAGTPLSMPVGLVAESLLMAVLVAALLMRERRRRGRATPAGPVRRWARRAGTWLTVFLTVSVVGHGTDYLVYARPLDRVVPVLAEAGALVEAGRRADATRLLSPSVIDDLEWSAAVAPRSPQRRADLAFARALTGDPRAGLDLVRAHALARSGDIAPVLGAVDIDVDTALTRAELALTQGERRDREHPSRDP
jgi:hypothetical protein